MNTGYHHNTMDKYVPGEVYINLKEFLKYRGIASDHKFLSTEKFSDLLNTNEYVRIDGVRTDGKGTQQNIFVFLIMPKSRFALRAPDFKKLLNTLPKAALEHAEIMFVSEAELTNHIKKQLDEFRSENRGTYIEAYTYDKFIIVVPLHVAVPKHEIAAKAEVDKWCEEFGTAREDLPKILSSDPPVVWLGAKPGDVVRIYRRSESAGHAVTMRHVIHG